MADNVFASYDLISDLAANLPANPNPANGRLTVFQATDTGVVYIWNGSAWRLIPPASASANLVYAGPSSGSAAAPGFRALVDADIPTTLSGHTMAGNTSFPSGIWNLSGNVGIGTTGPNASLEIHNAGTGASQLRLSSATSGNLGVDFTSSTAYSWQLGAQNEVGNAFTITPSTAAGGTTFTTPVVTVLSGGNVGIGTASPGTRLTVAYGTVSSSNLVYNALELQPAGGSAYGGNGSAMLLDSCTNDGIQTVGSINSFLQNGGSGGTNYGGGLVFSIKTTGSASLSEAMRIDESGNVGIGTASPHSKLTVVGLPVYANNAAAITGGLAAGDFYRTGSDPDPVCVVH